MSSLLLHFELDTQKEPILFEDNFSKIFHFYKAMTSVVSMFRSSCESQSTLGKWFSWTTKLLTELDKLNFSVEFNSPP